MSTAECPPTPPQLPTGEDARTPPPKDAPGSSSANKWVPSNRPDSPDPNCAICLGNLENMSYTDSCFHKFCFTCLVEWSKVKPECPLCKAKFKSIIHTIKSDQVYESYTIPPRPGTTVASVSLALLQEMRRFRYATTAGGIGERFPFFGLPALPLPFPNPPRQLNNRRPQQDHAARAGASTWRRRGGLATTDFRRDIYRQRKYVNPNSVVDISGRYRETSPEWFRSNPAQTHRLVPWLNRELNALLDDPQSTNCYVTQLILELITHHEIRSPEFYQSLLPHLRHRTQHFQHEFYNFARSCYDMVGHDLHALYEDNPQANDLNITTEVISSDSSQSESENSDEIFLLGEFPASDRPPLTLGGQSSRNSSTEDQPTTSSNLDQGPSTSRGLSANASQYIISSDEEIEPDKVLADNGEVEVVGYIKPRHLRTPVIVSLSSDDENYVKKEVVKKEEVLIDISDSDDNEDKLPLPNSGKRWSTSSDEEALSRKQKGKGKGKGKGKSSCRAKAAAQLPNCSTSDTPATASPLLSEAVTNSNSSPATTSERSRLISPMGLISTWRSQNKTASRSSRSSSSSRSRSRDPSREKSKKAKNKRTDDSCKGSSEKSSKRETTDKKRTREDKSRDRKRKSRKDHEDRRKERRHKAESESSKKIESESSKKKKKVRKAAEYSEVQSSDQSIASQKLRSYSDSEERPLAQIKRHKASRSRSSGRAEHRDSHSSRAENRDCHLGREKTRDSHSSRAENRGSHSGRDISAESGQERPEEDLRFLISRKRLGDQDLSNTTSMVTSSDEENFDEPKVKSIIVKIPKPGSSAS